MGKLTFSTIVASLVLSSGIAMADPADDSTVGDLTVEKRIYQHDGFGAQWAFDVGSEGLWFVNKNPKDSGKYDAPLKVDNNATANSLVIKEGGKVGIGTDEPTGQALDIHWTGEKSTNGGGAQLIKLKATNTLDGISSDAGFVLENGISGRKWGFQTVDHGKGFGASMYGSGWYEFVIKNTNNDYRTTALYLGSGAKCENGNWINASSRALKENIKELKTEDALKAFNSLKPVVYNYKADKKEQYVGFIAEDVPELVAINSRDGLGAMDMVAVLTKVVQNQAIKIRKLEKMQKRLSRVELLLVNLALKETISKEKLTIK